jgi:hypothetical protein
MSAEPASSRSRSVTHAIALLDPIAEALAHAHARGVCTPSVSLGRGRALAQGDAAPSSRSSYGAPEQRSVAYGIPGPWTDVFNLALVLVELLRALGIEPPPEVSAVVARALAPYPAERWQTAESFWRALREAAWIASGKPSLAQQPCPTSSASATSSARASTSSVPTSPCFEDPTSSSTP